MALSIRVIGMGLASVTLLQACATKGFVREQVGVVRDTLSAQIASEVGAERTAREQADEQLRSDIAALRTELQAMRTEFGAKITALEDGLKFAFPVNFAFDDATVRQQDQAALDRFAAVAQKYYPNATITVEGFADPAGSAAYNKELSQRRAESVKSYLVAKGMSDMQLRTVGYGEARQVNQGAQRDDAGAEANRRVVFVIEGVGQSAVAAVPTTSGF
ncbi:MAG TPA: OmpA family protein [Gemmatimonadaceae bacterium]|nr:OmpA family protein [Gemmatimonadaceae bacterium]